MTDLAERIAFSHSHRTLLLEDLMDAAAAFVQKNNYADRSEFILARQRNKVDYEPWFAICLPDGTELRVSVDITAVP